MEELNIKVPFRYDTDDRQGLCYFYAVANLTGDASILQVCDSQSDGYLNYEVNAALRNTDIALHDIAVGSISDDFWTKQIKKWRLNITQSIDKSDKIIPLVVNVPSLMGEHAIGVFIDLMRSEVYKIDSSKQYIEKWDLKHFIKQHDFRRVAVLVSRSNREMLVGDIDSVLYNR